MNRRPIATMLAAVVLLGALVVLVPWREVVGAGSSNSRPTATTGSASAITDTSATVNGTVNPRSTATTTYFQWGLSSSYGARTPDVTTSARSSVPVKAALTGLTPTTTYHFRLVATNAKGTSYGADAVFTTTGAPPSTSPTSTTPTSTTSTPTSSTSTAAGGVCTNPYFTTSDPNGGVSDGGYYVHNNLWNAAKYPGTTGTTQVCSYHSWNHIGTARNTGDGAVKTYPNVHKDHSRRTITSFPTLTSRFAATSPDVGIYNVAYDLWLNGVPNDEVMIWTDNHNQVPAGSRFATGVALSGYTWDVYAASGNGYIAFVPSNGTRLTSGTIDLKALLTYLVSAGRVASNSTVDQICYGVEIVDTGGVPATWNFTDFSITDS